MTEIKKLLELRKAIKRKKPVFVRRDARYKVRVPFKWRKPRGRHSPVRQRHKGKLRLVSIGYGSPKAVKHLHSSGLQKILINNKKELENLNPEKQGIIISSKVGNKKKTGIIKAALEKKLTILNLKEPQKHLEKLQSEFQGRKKSKEKKLTEKEKKELEKKKKAEEKEKKEKEEKEKSKELPSENEEGLEKLETSQREIEKEKKEEEKKEIEKTLIKKQ